MFKKLIFPIMFGLGSYGASYAGDNNLTLMQLSIDATKGDAIAQNKLGQVYELGYGDTAQNYPLALQWYLKAADQGNADAQCSAGRFYHSGLGVTQSDKEAVKWFRKSAQQGWVTCLGNLAYMYQHGLGVAQSDKDAYEWLKKSADQGSPDAEYEVGVMYFNGQGVPKSYSAAMSWYRKAAAHHFPQAANNLAYMYGNGLGVPQSDVEAFNWSLKAAELNFPPAQWAVANMYDKGVGVAPNPAQASVWRHKAFDAGYVPPVEPQPVDPGIANDQAQQAARAERQNKQLDPEYFSHANKAFLSNNFHELKMLKQGQLVYPKESLAKREFGTVIVWPSVNTEGKVTNATIHRSAGSYALDMAAQSAAMHTVYAPYIDPETHEARSVQTELIVEFKLPD